MPEQPSHRLPEEFGGNEWLVDELYERYQQDKNTVDAKWWPLFESFDAGDSLHQRSLRRSGSCAPRHPRTSRSSSCRAGSAAGRTCSTPPLPLPPPRRSPGHRCPRRLQDLGSRPRHRADPGPAPQEHQGPDRPRGRRRLRPPRTGQGHRHQHDHQPGGSDRHQRAGHPGEAADRQPRGHQLQPGPCPGQGFLHAPDRLRRHPRPGPVPLDERLLRRGRRQACRGPAGARELRHRHRHAQARRHPPADGARTSRRRRPSTSPSSGTPTRT